MDILPYQFIKTLSRLGFIKEIYLFGSRAKGTNGLKSDIDLAIVCPDASDNEWLLIMDIIEEADTLLSIDCVRFDSLKAGDSLFKEIVKDKVILWKQQN